MDQYHSKPGFGCRRRAAVSARPPARDELREHFDRGRRRRRWWRRRRRGSLHRHLELAPQRLAWEQHNVTGSFNEKNREIILEVHRINPPKNTACLNMKHGFPQTRYNARKLEKWVIWFDQINKFGTLNRRNIFKLLIMFMISEF